LRFAGSPTPHFQISPDPCPWNSLPNSPPARAWLFQMIRALFTSPPRRGRQRSASWEEERLVGACPMILLRKKARACRRPSGIQWSASAAAGVALLRFHLEVLRHASSTYRPQKQPQRLLRFLLQPKLINQEHRKKHDIRNFRSLGYSSMKTGRPKRADFSAASTASRLRMPSSSVGASRRCPLVRATNVSKAR
jgi:hypothetical protein